LLGTNTRTGDLITLRRKYVNRSILPMLLAERLLQVHTWKELNLSFHYADIIVQVF